MAYDEQLAGRIREILGRRKFTEMKMFGGLGFLVGGNMAVAASGQGGILVRVDPEESEALVRKGPAKPMEMRGRSMTGWLRVDAKHLSKPAELEAWVSGECATRAPFRRSEPTGTQRRRTRSIAMAEGTNPTLSQNSLAPSRPARSTHVTCVSLPSRCSTIRRPMPCRRCVGATAAVPM